ncbi:hypothetical protein CVT24_011355 [Panaeolus cyanescens]|uniref:Uncharacterized protein n=1 Tax=Panaeolus cyanescens TaxID=181874 RepID=A0A409YGL3_9AGAR|nr:hypothetical protein CVT24_011355 [Panaeolus cyanescens]
MQNAKAHGQSHLLLAEPSRESLTFRAQLATEVSSLRRIRPKVPFFRLAAHRIPTLHLFRSLLRAAPDANIKFRVGALFRKYRGLTSPTQTVQKLEIGYKFLAFFQKAPEGGEHEKQVLSRYSRLIEAKRQKIYLNTLIDMEQAELNRLRTRPILTGGFHTPDIYHGPLPWMVPQPPNVSGIILSRRKARAKRLVKQSSTNDTLEDLSIERDLEERAYQEARRLRKDVPKSKVYADEAYTAWTTPLKQMLDDISKSYELDAQRANTPYSPELLETIFEARREKIRNKTNQKEREARGEYFASTRKGMRSGPPSHIWQTMSPKQRDIQRVLRQPTKVGWTGMVRRQHGLKLSDDETRWADALEKGCPSNRDTLDKVERTLKEESELRREVEEQKLSANYS